MVNTRGRVMWVHAWEVENLRGQGCRPIINPKEEYYPQYDQNIVKSEVVDDIKNPEADEYDVLECEEIT